MSPVRHTPPTTRLPPPSSVQVCPSSDPLDSKDFNHIDYINQLFPTEQVGLVCLVSRVALSVAFDPLPSLLTCTLSL